MEAIVKDYLFDETHFLQVVVINPGTIPFNCPVDDAEHVLVSDGNSLQRLNVKLYGAVINPAKKTLFRKHRKDPKGYTLYFVPKKSIKPVLFGGHTNNANENMPQIQYEQINYQGSFVYEIVDSKQFVKTISDKQNFFSQDYFDEKIKSRIKLDVESICSKYIETNQLQGLSSTKKQIKEDIENAISKSLLEEFGISINITKLDFAEDEKHKEVREKVEISKYIGDKH